MLSKDDDIRYWDQIAALQFEFAGQTRPANYQLGQNRSERLQRELTALLGDFVCEVCGMAQPYIHHRNYHERNKETMNDVMFLCPLCHRRVHSAKATKRLSELKIDRPFQLSLLFLRNLQKETT